MMNSILTSADYHAIIKTIVTVFSLRKQSYRVTECQIAQLRCLALFLFSAREKRVEINHSMAGMACRKGHQIMLKMIITEAVVSKGYDGAPAIRFYDGDGSSQIANFRVGKRVYDSKADNNHRWLNFNVKAFGDVCERIKRMKLKEGSYINLTARYDEETWETKDTHETRTGAVLYLEEIEFAGGGNGQKNGQSSAGGTAPQSTGGYPAPQSQGQPPQPAEPMPGNFTGFEGFAGGENPFF